MASTYEINQRGIELVSSRLKSAGATVAKTGERGIHLFVTFPGATDSKAVAVRANLTPKPGGGTGKMALDWWVDDDATADLIALADLSTDRVWLMTIEELRSLAQQHPKGSHHIFMVVEEAAISKHPRILDKHFAEFLLPPEGDFRSVVGSGEPALAAIDETIAALEGHVRQRMVRHRYRERALRSAKIAAALQHGGGRLRCEVLGCQFDFEARYGLIGRGYAQVHHLKPLAEADAPVETKLEDLAIVCANCHAMIHIGGQTRPLTELIAGR